MLAKIHRRACCSLLACLLVGSAAHGPDRQLGDGHAAEDVLPEGGTADSGAGESSVDLAQWKAEHRPTPAPAEEMESLDPKAARAAQRAAAKAITEAKHEAAGRDHGEAVSAATGNRADDKHPPSETSLRPPAPVVKDKTAMPTPALPVKEAASTSTGESHAQEGQHDSGKNAETVPKKVPSWAKQLLAAVAGGGEEPAEAAGGSAEQHGDAGDAKQHGDAGGGKEPAKAAGGSAEQHGDAGDAKQHGDAGDGPDSHAAHGDAEKHGGAKEEAPAEEELDLGEDHPGAGYGSGVPWPPWPSDPPPLPDIYALGEDLDFEPLPLPEGPKWPLIMPEPPAQADEEGGSHKRIEDIVQGKALQRMRRKERQRQQRRKQERQAPGDWDQKPIDVDNITATLRCSAYDIVWEPLDMHMHGLYVEENVSACQRRCAITAGCGHFAYWLPAGHCHLQSAFAHPTWGRLGFVSGPPGCTLNQRSKDLLSIILKKRVCLEEDTAYIGVFQRLPVTMPNVRTCQQQCHTWNSHTFTFNTVSGLCHCENEGAKKVTDAFSVSGPPTCQPIVSFTIHMDGVLWDELRSQRGMLSQFETKIAQAVAAAAGGTALNISTDNIGVVVTETEVPLVQVLVQPPNSVDSDVIQMRLQESSLIAMVEVAVNDMPTIRTVSIRVRSISAYVIDDEDADYSEKYAASRGMPIGPHLWDSTRSVGGAFAVAGALLAAAVVGHRVLGRSKARRRSPLGFSSCSEESQDMRDVEVVTRAQRLPRSNRPKLKSALSSKYLVVERDAHAAGLLAHGQREEEEEAAAPASSSQEWMRLEGGS